MASWIFSTFLLPSLPGCCVNELAGGSYSSYRRSVHAPLDVFLESKFLIPCPVRIRNVAILDTADHLLRPEFTPRWSPGCTCLPRVYLWVQLLRALGRHWLEPNPLNSLVLRILWVSSEYQYKQNGMTDGNYRWCTCIYKTKYQSLALMLQQIIRLRLLRSSSRESLRYQTDTQLTLQNTTDCTVTLSKFCPLHYVRKDLLCSISRFLFL